MADNDIHASIHKRDIDIGSEKKDKEKDKEKSDKTEKKSGGWIQKVLDKKK
jgi:hypothetical protein